MSSVSFWPISTTKVTEAAATIEGAFRLVCDIGDADVALSGDFLEYALETFNKIIAINLNSVFFASQRAAKTMIASGIEGAIVIMSSVNAQLAIPTILAYCASKGDVMQLSKVASIALAKDNMRVNAVGSGSIDTAMMTGVNANPEAFKTAMSRHWRR